jgi:hypothetical protein
LVEFRELGSKDRFFLHLSFLGGNKKLNLSRQNYKLTNIWRDLGEEEENLALLCQSQLKLWLNWAVTTHVCVNLNHVILSTRAGKVISSPGSLRERPHHSCQRAAFLGTLFQRSLYFSGPDNHILMIFFISLGCGNKTVYINPNKTPIILLSTPDTDHILQT